MWEGHIPCHGLTAEGVGPQEPVYRELRVPERLSSACDKTEETPPGTTGEGSEAADGKTKFSFPFLLPWTGYCGAERPIYQVPVTKPIATKISGGTEEASPV